ncbi:MAG TPA: ATP-binding protein [Dokdonella sp.]|nr:HAMP domain-containing protein [Xanthomonadales bacterium]MBK7210136.1 HAMP domain-containing protein [Xanthomonadales bacterium]HQW76307.1 ATP-binding protein [Dokdonella sp.]HQX66497.1 ATP-binding protein [Dokdonella sp.]HQZ61797.1 ATP-binding protein [Dokdonella sp.]
MNLRLWQRLFLTFAALASIALAGFVIWQQQAFRKGFLAYLDQAALERLQPVSDRLAEAYDENGNWDFLRNDTRQFGELILPERHRAQRQSKRIERLREALPPEAAADVAQRHPPPAWRENEREREGRRRVLEGSLLSRLLLVDAQGAPVVGDPAIARGSASVPIMLDGERIGSLLLAALPRIRSAADLAFAREQLRNALIAGVAILGLALLLAFALARWLLTPVRELAAGTRALAAGDYTRRMGNRRRDELGALAADFNHLAHTLEQHREARRRWGADIAHELRTPLSILRGEIQALQDGVRTATPAALNSLHAECERMGGLIEDLYQLSLADAGALEYHFEPLDMGEVLAEALETQLPSLEESGLAVATAIASVPPIRGDARRLGQLIDNLLMNTRRYTDAPGRLRIELSAVAGEVILVLEDSAPGVPSDSLELLFDRLYRVDASRNRAAGGTGLGLAICLAIVTAHGGHIAASASALGGLRIEVRLPAIGAGA